MHDGGSRLAALNVVTTDGQVIAPSTEQDVCSAIKMAHSPVTVISGGHHYEGWSALDDATVIELSLMNTIEPSADGSMITISAGVTHIRTKRGRQLVREAAS